MGTDWIGKTEEKEEEKNERKKKGGVGDQP